ncbi:hypothetical protein ACFU2J_24280 [Streptomyces sp. NPDC057387]|uniref:hypothetical protein n=1 Tax=Streptomyces sp. NPDC057387 TaxID=3346115 RepID=UPI0036403411
MRGAEDGGPAERAGAETDMGARHGEGRGRDAGPRPAPGDAPGTEALLAAALRGEGTDVEGERRAVAAFRAARDAEPGRAARTRRRDDWRPRTGRDPGRSLKTALSVLLASLTLGGVAYAAIGGGGSGDDDGGGPDRTPPPPPPPPPPAPPAATPPAATRDPAAPGHAATPPGSTASPGASAPPGASPPPDRPAAGRDPEAQCRAYARVTGSGKALGATAWQRLVAAAGGADHVEAYCTELLARPTGQGASADTGNGAAGNDAGNGRAGDTGAGIGADGTVGEGGVEVETGGSAAVRVPDQDLP